VKPVIIIGAGPAGTAAALSLLNARVPVIILERAPFPRYRPGETLHPGIEPLLNTLGVSDILHEANQLRQDGIWSAWGESLRFVPYGGDAGGPWRGFQVTRGEFDRRMLERSCHRGASLVALQIISVLRDSSEAVTGLITSVGVIHSDYVIDCTGGVHTLARRIGIPIVRHSPKLIARFGYVRGHFNGPAPLIRCDTTGWTWIAEVEPDRFQWTRVTGTSHIPEPQWLPDCLKDLDAEPSRGADVTWRVAQTVAGPGWFLAGDAAAVLDPSSSHGMLHAVMMGMTAAHLIVRRLLHGASMEACVTAYQEWLFAWFRHDAREMRRTYGMANLFGSGLSGGCGNSDWGPD
jgi:flavin-dependent dehydrogenase